MLNLPALKIIFFDIGNVFVSDDPSGCFVYKALFDRLAPSRPELTPEEFFNGRTRHVEAGGSVWSYVKEHISGPDFEVFKVQTRRAMYRQWGAVSPPVPGMDAMARRLARHYTLGIIANQPAEVEDLLAERQLINLFPVRAISDKLNLFKPDRRLYENALETAGVAPHEALMVGDRIDNDIRPAKAVGMQTLWLKLGNKGRGWLPTTDFEHCYAHSVASASWSDQEPATKADQPDAIAETPDDILKLLIA